MKPGLPLLNALSVTRQLPSGVTCGTLHPLRPRPIRETGASGGKSILVNWGW